MQEDTASQYRIPTAPLSESEVFELRRKIHATKGWVSFMGVMLIVLGCLMGVAYPALGVALIVMGGWTGIPVIVVGIVIAIIAIWIGAILAKAARGGKLFTEQSSELGAFTYHEKLRKYFAFRGVLSIIGLCLLGVAAIVLIVSLFTTGLMWSF